MLKIIITALLFLLTACDKPWNDPYPKKDLDASTVYTAFTERPKHLDPAKAYNDNEWALISQIYEPPLQYHYLKRPFTLVPQASSMMPDIRYYDAQGKLLQNNAEAAQIASTSYIIHLRTDLRYQTHPAFYQSPQGHYPYQHLTADDLRNIDKPTDFEHLATRTATADDYIYQIKRMADPVVNSPLYSVMEKNLVGFKALSDAIDKARAGKRGFFDLNSVAYDGAKRIDAQTFEIKVQGKYPQFIYWLATPFFSPMAWEVDAFYDQPVLIAKNITLDWFPVGTGPFYLRENNPNLRMILQKNDEFHLETYPSEGMPGDKEKGLLQFAGEKLPLVDRVYFVLEKENFPYWNKFLQGYYDRSGISSDNFDAALQFSSLGDPSVSTEMQEKKIYLTTSVDPSIFYWGFNMLDDTVGGLTPARQKLRQAISIAVNTEEYISIFLNGRGLPADFIIPPSIPGFVGEEAGLDPYIYDWVDGKAQRKSIDVAKALLTEAGYPKGVDPATHRPLVLHFDTPSSSGPDNQAVLDWMRKQFKKINIELEIRATQYNRFQEKMDKGNAQIYGWGWHADYPDPENFLSCLYGQNTKAKNDGENASNYQNPDFDALFRQMSNLENGPKRQAMIDQMRSIAQKDAPLIWGYYPMVYTLSHNWMYPTKPSEISSATVKYIRVNPEQRFKFQQLWNHPIFWPLLLMVAFVFLLWLIPYLKYRQAERHLLPKRGAK